MGRIIEDKLMQTTCVYCPRAYIADKAEETSTSPHTLTHPIDGWIREASTHWRLVLYTYNGTFTVLMLPFWGRLHSSSLQTNQPQKEDFGEITSREIPSSEG